MLAKISRSRYFIVFILFIFLYFIALLNLYIIQIKQSHFFSSLAQHQHKVIITKKPIRGLIYDRTRAKPLALNKDSFSAFITPISLHQPEETKAFLNKHFPEIYKKIIKSNNKSFMYIKRRLSPQELNLIQNSNIEDIKLLKEKTRFYPIKSLGSIIGITNIDNNGSFGLEKQYEKLLSGTSSTYTLEKDARFGHFYFKKQMDIKGKIPKPIYLTIDSDLQFLVYEELKEAKKAHKAKETAALILDPTTGDILAMANYPTFNPNKTKDLNITFTKNTVACNAYEVGSVIKVFLALAALEEDIANPDTIIDCENTRFTKINKTKVKTWKAHDKLTLSEVIQYSNNIGTAKIALELKEKLYNHYKKLGFGQKINIFLGENSGFITPPSLWSKASPISLSFGYEISSTLLQIAQAFTVISNNGKLTKPRIDLNSPITTSYQLYQTKTIENIRKILQKTITSGTAKRANISGYTVMGKTGTANLLENGKYNPSKNIYTFAGIIEKDNYKRIIITFVKEVEKKNTYASRVAAPLFEKIANKLIIHDKII